MIFCRKLSEKTPFHSKYQKLELYKNHDLQFRNFCHLNELYQDSYFYLSKTDLVCASDPEAHEP